MICPDSGYFLFHDTGLGVDGCVRPPPQKTISDPVKTLNNMEKTFLKRKIFRPIICANIVIIGSIMTGHQWFRQGDNLGSITFSCYSNQDMLPKG